MSIVIVVHGNMNCEIKLPTTYRNRKYGIKQLFKNVVCAIFAIEDVIFILNSN